MNSEFPAVRVARREIRGCFVRPVPARSSFRYLRAFADSGGFQAVLSKHERSEFYPGRIIMVTVRLRVGPLRLHAG